MNLDKVFQRGLEVDIYSKALDQSWKSEVFGVDEGLILAQLPSDGADIERLRPNVRLKLSALAETGRYNLETEVFELRGDISLLALKPLKEASVIQRREFYRLRNPNIGLKYRLVETSQDLYSSRLYFARALDISGGGAAIEIPNDPDIKVKKRIRLQIHLPSLEESINIVGEILGATLGDDGFLTVRVYFNTIKESDRDKVIGFLLKEQAIRRD
ncbi:MAG: PilZ domain-containing protein [Actinomycetota bacterium]|nr:PilZ domain-containing protein [Actinomycetota bacterium]